jgi:hypothetical protein
VNTTPKNLVASILARLRNQSKEERVPFNQVLQFYAMERFLYRLSKTRHVDGVLLKGALLLRQAGLPRSRPTMDIDLLRQGATDRDTLVALVRDCVMTEGDGDGVEFNPDSIEADVIKKDAAYEGIRVRVTGCMDRVRLNVQIDFGVGDAVFPSPRVVEYPTFIQEASIRLRAYPIEAAIAEKFQAMVELDMANSRMKDFYDIWAYSLNLNFDGAILARSFAATFERRGTKLPSELPTALAPVFFGAASHQQQWQAFVRRIAEPDLAFEFPAVVVAIASFVMPPSIAAFGGQRFECSWCPPGPWASTR